MLTDSATAASVIFAANRARGSVTFDVHQVEGVTRRRHLHESGSLRVRFPSPETEGLSAVFVNTAGGMNYESIFPLLPTTVRQITNLDIAKERGRFHSPPCENGQSVSSSMRPASDSDNFGRSITFAEPVSKNRPGSRFRSMATLMTGKSSGTCWTSSRVTGVFNTALLVGSFDRLVDTPYGRLLLVKLALVATMVAVALGNRFRLLPRLLGSMAPAPPLHALCRSVAVEQVLGLAILAVVAVLGTWPPALTR